MQDARESKTFLDRSVLSNCLRLFLECHLQITDAVREETELILEILQCIDVVTSLDEIKHMFSRTPMETHLVEAILAGGAAGTVDVSNMLMALRAAMDHGSVWAPLWLGDVEGELEDGDDDVSTEQRREWYSVADCRGHPEAAARLSTLSSVPSASQYVDDIAEMCARMAGSSAYVSTASKDVLDQAAEKLRLFCEEDTDGSDCDEEALEEALELVEDADDSVEDDSALELVVEADGMVEDKQSSMTKRLERTLIGLRNFLTRSGESQVDDIMADLTHAFKLRRPKSRL